MSHITDYTLPPAGREELEVHPRAILAGRAINDSMPGYVALMAIKGLNDVGKVIKGSKVLIMGLTYKENVPDTRESPVRELVAWGETQEAEDRSNAAYEELKKGGLVEK